MRTELYLYREERMGKRAFLMASCAARGECKMCFIGLRGKRGLLSVRAIEMCDR